MTGMRNRLIVAAFVLFSGSTVYRLLTGAADAWTVVNRGDDPNRVTLKVWAGNASPIDRWRTEAAVVAARELNARLESEGKDVRVSVEAVNDPASWGNYKRKFLMAADSHLAPDIICTGHEDIASWASAGLIVPIADSVEAVRALDPAFADVRDDLWESTLFRGKVWGVPQDSEARVLFFSKPLLAKMGWTHARMKTLERRIHDGSFTTDDMIRLAREAVETGVVPRGRGYWPRPTRGSDHLQKYYAFGGRIADRETGRLVADEEALTRWFAFQRRIVDAGITPENYPGTEWGIWHDTVAHGKVLFWEGGIWNWSLWADKYIAALGGRATLERTVGYALPAGRHAGRLAGDAGPSARLLGPQTQGLGTDPAGARCEAARADDDARDQYAARPGELAPGHFEIPARLCAVPKERVSLQCFEVGGAVVLPAQSRPLLAVVRHRHGEHGGSPERAAHPG